MAGLASALTALVRGFRFEVTFHVSAGQGDDEPHPEGDVYSVTERSGPIGFQPAEYE